MLLTSTTEQSFNVLHEIPGRCRLRFHNLKANKLLQAKLEKKMKSSVFIHEFIFRLDCNCVVIRFEGSAKTLFLKLL